MVARGKFIVFEGLDGAGKTTQVGHLVEHVRNKGHQVITTYEPGGTPVGDMVRQALLRGQQPLLPQTEAPLLAAARYEHWSTCIKPALEAGIWVICDRFWLSTLAYQGYGRQLGELAIAQLHAWIWRDQRVQADATVILAADPQACWEQRAHGADSDKIESLNLEFYQRVARGYHRARYVDRSCVWIEPSGQEAEAVAQRVWQAIQDKWAYEGDDKP